MSTSKDTLKTWFQRGVKQGATHMIVVCDTYDWVDFPVYVSPEEDVREVEAKYGGVNMQKIMEVYNLNLNMDAQMAQHQAFNY